MINKNNTATPITPIFDVTLTSNNNILEIEWFDYILGIYIKDNKFNSFVHQNYIEYNNKFIMILDMLKYLYKRYRDLKDEDVKITKWL